MIKDQNAPPRFSIRVENGHTWILSDRFIGSDVGGVTHHHNGHGDHYQPWLLVDGSRIEIGTPLSQLDQAAQEIEVEFMKRAGDTAKICRQSKEKHRDRPAEDDAVVIPDSTQFVIVELDRENERVQVEFMLDGQLMRAWVPAAHLEKMARN